MQAFLKAVAKSTRYAALAHRLEALEHGIHIFSMGKYAHMPGLLVQTWTHTQRRAAELDRVIAGIQADAVAIGWQLELNEEFVLDRAGGPAASWCSLPLLPAPTLLLLVLPAMQRCPSSTTGCALSTTTTRAD